MNHLAYVFERFPSFTQTFCVREILELERQGLRPLLFSIHDVRDEAVQHFPTDLLERVHFLPPQDELVATIQQLKDARQLPQSVVLTLREWGDAPDKARVYEAAYIGWKMQSAGVRHAHAHFAGLAARTCWWLSQFYQHTYGFTGHANDMFVDPGLPVTLDLMLRDCAYVATVSDYTADWLRGKFPARAAKVHRVYNGLDLETITQQTVGKPKVRPPLIYSVGRLIEKKGFDDLIRACAVLRTEGKNFQCTIAGEGPLEAELSAQIQAAGLAETVLLLGAQSQPQILEQLARATIFALPCVTERDGGKDNLPTVLMEAMAAALPCVSTRVAGVPEMVLHEKTGLLCEERQPEIFASLLSRLLENPDLGKRFGEAGLVHASKNFAQEHTARQLLALQIEFGDVAVDAKLQSSHATLGKAYRRQRWHRLARWWQRRKPAKQAIHPASI